MKNEALKLHSIGLKVIPTDLNKRPLCKWKQYQTSQTKEDIETLFSGNVEGMALLTGDGIEVIDIDTKYFLEHDLINKIFDAVIDSVGMAVYNQLIITHTQSGGFHVIYRTDVAEGNQKLASRYTTDEERKNEHDKLRVLLETRGDAGYILIPPTKGYKYDSPKYTLHNIPKLTNDQRNALIAAMRSFDETSENHQKNKAPIPIEVQGSSKSTIEAFNEAHSPVELIEAAGWEYSHTRGDNDYYTRAGKDKRDGISAAYSNSLKLLYVFTTSSQFDSNRAYNSFQTYAYLHHSGDYKAAAKELYQSGYGDRITGGNKDHKNTVSIIASDNKQAAEKIEDSGLMAEIFNSRLDVSIKPKEKPNTLFMFCESARDYIGIGGDGDLVNFFGKHKSRKSAAGACAASCFLEGGKNESLNFRANFDGRNLIHFDTEQNKTDHHKLACEMLYQAELPTDRTPANYYSFHLMPYSKTQRINFVKYCLESVDNIGCVFLDGVVDLCRNYNDLEEASDLVTFLMNMASKHKFLLINVLHNARSTGQARGHLGTELLNKAKCNINVVKEKEQEYSRIEIESLRGGRTPTGFEFLHDENGHLIFY